MYIMCYTMPMLCCSLFALVVISNVTCNVALSIMIQQQRPIKWYRWSLPFNNSSPLIPHICVSESVQHWFRSWLVAYSAPSYYLNQCWVIVNWAVRNKLQWHLKFYDFHSRKCIWKCRLPEWQPFCPGEIELINLTVYIFSQLLHIYIYLWDLFCGIPCWTANPAMKLLCYMWCFGSICILYFTSW